MCFYSNHYAAVNVRGSMLAHRSVSAIRLDLKVLALSRSHFHAHSETEVDSTTLVHPDCKHFLGKSRISITEPLSLLEDERDVRAVAVLEGHGDPEPGEAFQPLRLNERAGVDGIESEVGCEARDGGL